MEFIQRGVRKLTGLFGPTDWRGLALLDHKGATAKAASLKAWLGGLVFTYDDKIIGVDARAAAIGGQLEAKALAAGHDPGMADAVIAGAAAAHELVVITRNTKHFLPFGIAALSPDEAAAQGGVARDAAAIRRLAETNGGAASATNRR